VLEGGVCCPLLPLAAFFRVFLALCLGAVALFFVFGPAAWGLARAEYSKEEEDEEEAEDVIPPDA
jgi:hypothetical protein